MSLRLSSLAVGCAAVLAGISLASNDAHACGGCFHPENEPETTVVTAHRMALSVSKAQTVLWDQVEYAGAPSEFAWVLPVKAGAYIELSSDAWFEALDAATSTRVVAPSFQCAFSGNDFEGGGYYGDEESSGCSCTHLLGAHADSDRSAESPSLGNSGAAGGGPPPPPPVTVVHQGSVGPYDTVTLHANVPNALPEWLTKNGFAIDAAVEPIIDAYVAEGFDFIALRLQPDADVKQMKPVRVVSPGASPVLPLRMVAAGTGANVDITLFVIGEGRWEAENFPNKQVDVKDLSWDFAASASNFSVHREELLAEEKGRTWLTTYSKPGALFSSIMNPVTSAPVTYTLSTTTASTIGELYIQQGFENGETDTDTCLQAFAAYENSDALIVDPCAAAANGGEGGAGGGGGAGGSGAGDCGAVESGQIDAKELACADLDDVAIAITGMHPKDVWLTRLESNLPREALNNDFALRATQPQDSVENWLTASTLVNPPCDVVEASTALRGPDEGSTDRRNKRNAALLGLVVAALGGAVLRRARRPVVLSPVRSHR